MRPVHLEIYALLFIIPTAIGMVAHWAREGFTGDVSLPLLAISGLCLIIAGVWRWLDKRKTPALVHHLEGEVGSITLCDDGREEALVDCGDERSFTMTGDAGQWVVGDKVRLNQRIERVGATT